MPKPVQTPGPGLALSRLYGLKGKVGLTLDEVVVPVHVIGQSFQNEGPVYSGSQLSPAGGAGQCSGVGLLNPADSGVLATIIAFRGATLAGAGSPWQVRVERGTSLPNTSGTTFQPTDLRIVAASSCFVTTYDTTGEPAITGPVLHGLTTLEPIDVLLEVPFTLPPGTQFVMNAALAAANQAFRGNIVWRETPLLPSEALAP